MSIITIFVLICKYLFISCSIEAIPSQLFVQLTDLLFLDLSHNRLETLPPQTRRLVNLQTLILNGNPMANYQMRQLPSLTALRSLQVRDTQRSVLNIPSSLEALLDVGEVDLSQNGLSRIPDGLFVLPTLRRLNMSNNIMTELHSAIGKYRDIE
jgi:Leucine-rich repeat (LRR) protein